MSFYPPNYNPKKRVRYIFKSKKPSLTVQSEKDFCDVNHIMSRYHRDGIIEHVRTVKGRYGDFTEVTDYQTALNVVHDASDMFMSLPSSIRSKFDNDPHLFLEFATNPDNLDELRDLGLAPKKSALPAVEDSPAEGSSEPVEAAES
jgi:phage internal scaffolding protein